MKYFWKIKYVATCVQMLSNLCFSCAGSLHSVHNRCMILTFEDRAELFSQKIRSQRDQKVLSQSFNTFVKFKLFELSNFTHLTLAYFSVMNDHRRFTQNCSVHFHYMNLNETVTAENNPRYRFLTTIIIPLESKFSNNADIVLPLSYPQFVYFILNEDEVANLHRVNAKDILLHRLSKNLYQTWQYKTVYYSIINHELYAICIHCYKSGYLNQQMYHKVGVANTKDADSLIKLWRELNYNLNGLEVAHDWFLLPKNLYNYFCNRRNKLLEYYDYPEICVVNEILQKLNLTFVARSTSEDSINRFCFVFEVLYDTLFNRGEIRKKRTPGHHMSAYCKIHSSFRLGFFAHINSTSYNLTASLLTLQPIQIQTLAYILLISFAICLALQFLWRNSIANEKSCKDCACNCSGMFYGLAVVLNQYNPQQWERARSNQRFFSVVYGSWLIIVFFICMHFSSALTSYLTKAPSVDIPDDFNELIFNEKWKHVPIISTSHVLQSRTKTFYLRHQILQNSMKHIDKKYENFLFDKIYPELNKRLIELE